MNHVNSVLLTLLALGAALPCAAEEGGTRKTVYVCDTGSLQVNSIEPCAPGKLVGAREAIVYPSGIIEAIPEAQASAPAAGTAETGASDKPDIAKLETVYVLEAAPSTKEPVLKNGQKSLIKFLAFGLVFGILAKLLRRSFFGGFFIGLIAEVVLVALKLIQP
jgi:hypothetical protein